jgi:hypothetical protein
MKVCLPVVSLLLFLSSFSFGQTQQPTCNCPPNKFGLSDAKADTVFHLLNGKSVALCGSRNTNVVKGRTFYSEFVLAACGEAQVIKFWGATLVCQLHVHHDTLIVETLERLPAGKNMRYKWIVWTIERIYFRHGKAVNDFSVNRHISRYTKQEIRLALLQYEKMGETLSNANMEVADKLFMSAISGSVKARVYLKDFNHYFAGLDGDYLEWYDGLVQKLKVWDTGTDRK